jgi:hypothetical protein
MRDFSKSYSSSRSSRSKSNTIFSTCMQLWKNHQPPFQIQTPAHLPIPVTKATGFLLQVDVIVKPVATEEVTMWPLCSAGCC